MKLRRSLARADKALRDLERSLIEDVVVEKTVDMWGEPIQQEEAAPTRQRVNLRPLFTVWEPFERSVLEALDHWEMNLWPLVRIWVGPNGTKVNQQVLAATSQMEALRERTQELLRRVRSESTFIPELRPALMAMFASLEVANRAEDEIIPGLLSGSPELANHTAATAPPRHTAQDITRNLRTLHFEDDDEPEVGMIGRIVGWLRR